MGWPDDADGDVLRRMQANGFDFSKPAVIDFDVDFASWPPSAEAMMVIQRTFRQVDAYNLEADSDGYIEIKVFAFVTYDLVMSMQSSISAITGPFGGKCQSWGVLH